MTWALKDHQEVGQTEKGMAGAGTSPHRKEAIAWRELAAEAWEG